MCACTIRNGVCVSSYFKSMTRLLCVLYLSQEWDLKHLEDLSVTILLKSNMHICKKTPTPIKYRQQYQSLSDYSLGFIQFLGTSSKSRDPPSVSVQMFIIDILDLIPSTVFTFSQVLRYSFLSSFQFLLIPFIKKKFCILKCTLCIFRSLNSVLSVSIHVTLIHHNVEMSDPCVIVIKTLHPSWVKIALF